MGHRKNANIAKNSLSSKVGQNGACLWAKAKAKARPGWATLVQKLIFSTFSIFLM